MKVSAELQKTEAGSDHADSTGVVKQTIRVMRMLVLPHHMCGPKYVNVNSGVHCNDDCTVPHSNEEGRQEADPVEARYVKTVELQW